MGARKQTTVENRIENHLKNGSPKVERVVIEQLTEEIAAFRIEGLTPYVQNQFHAKYRDEIIATQEEGDKAKNKKARPAKDFGERYKLAQHVTPDGLWGIPAAAFRAAMISACRLTKFKMTMAKMSIFVDADAYSEDGTALVLFTEIPEDKPTRIDKVVRNHSGVIDIRARPLFKPGWKATVRCRWDGDQFDATSVCNLLERAGRQVGVGEGRPDSPKSAGMGWGTFRIVHDESE